MNEKKFRTTITTTEAAARLGITPRHVRHLIKTGQLPATKQGRDWLIDENDLQLAEARRKPGRPRKGGTMYSVYAVKPTEPRHHTTLLDTPSRLHQ